MTTAQTSVVERTARPECQELGMRLDPPVTPKTAPNKLFSNLQIAPSWYSPSPHTENVPGLNPARVLQVIRTTWFDLLETLHGELECSIVGVIRKKEECMQGKCLLLNATPTLNSRPITQEFSPGDHNHTTLFWLIYHQTYLSECAKNIQLSKGRDDLFISDLF